MTRTKAALTAAAATIAIAIAWTGAEARVRPEANYQDYWKSSDYRYVAPEWRVYRMTVVKFKITKRHKAKHHRHVAKRVRHHATTRVYHSPAVRDLVAPLAAKVREIVGACGSKLVSGYRPGARVRGSGRLSLHASYPARAADLAGNPSCIRRHLAGWPGGLSIDYARVRHYHVSYEPGGREWHARFQHYGHSRVRYARAR